MNCKILLLVLALIICYCSIAVVGLLEVTSESEIVSIDGDFELEDENYEWPESCPYWGYRQDIPQFGMHIICARSGKQHTTELAILKHGMTEVYATFPKDLGDVEELIEFLYETLGTTNNRPKDKWIAYNAFGERYYSTSRILYEEGALLFTNGVWTWPGVRVGYLQQTNGFRLKTLSLRPLVFQVENFLSDEECDYIRTEADAYMVPSYTNKMDHDRHLPDTTWRTSSQHFLSSTDRPMIKSIDNRVAMLTHTRVQQQEFVQVLRYENGQKYDHHTDYFDPQYYQKDASTLALIKNGEKNRMITVLWYLSDVEEGGQTMFPRSNGSVPTSFSDCSSTTAVSVFPKKGQVVIFYDLYPDGSLDSFSLHGSCPVKSGTKWAANKWIWTESAGYIL